MIYILDFETNGLTLGDVEITQASYLRIDENFNITKEYNKYFYTDNLKSSAKITGLTHSKLANLSGGVEFTRKDLLDILEELTHGIIIGQNIDYDIAVLDATCLRHELRVLPKYPLDVSSQYSPEGTYMNLKWIVDHHITDKEREALNARFEGDSLYHNSLYDVYSLYHVIKADPDFKKRLNHYLKTVPRR